MLETQLINGRALADQLNAVTHERVMNLWQQYSIKPRLDVIMIGDAISSTIYVKRKKKRAQKLGIECKIYSLPDSIKQDKLAQKIAQLSQNTDVHGIILQLPLPQHIDSFAMQNIVPPDKDVDGVTIQNAGRRVIHRCHDGFYPCTALGVIHLIKTVQSDLTGLNAHVIGRSEIVGRPTADLLMRENCTVTISHAQSQSLSAITQAADILVTATGQPKLVNREWVKRGAIVIDVGITRNQNNNLQGDCDFNDLQGHAGYITPVPKGVGPMTVAYLMHNTFLAAQKAHNITSLNDEE